MHPRIPSIYLFETMCDNVKLFNCQKLHDSRSIDDRMVDRLDGRCYVQEIKHCRGGTCRNAEGRRIRGSRLVSESDRDRRASNHQHCTRRSYATRKGQGRRPKAAIVSKYIQLVVRFAPVHTNPRFRKFDSCCQSRCIRRRHAGSNRPRRR
jgi:hypothetical protein